MIHRALLAEDDRRRAARENFHMITVPIIQQATYEPALHHVGEEHDEGKLTEILRSTKRYNTFLLITSICYLIYKMLYLKIIKLLSILLIIYRLHLHTLFYKCGYFVSAHTQFLANHLIYFFIIFNFIFYFFYCIMYCFCRDSRLLL